jgi:hypothetical protein
LKKKKALIYNKHFQNFRCQGNLVHRIWLVLINRIILKTDLTKIGSDSVDYIHLIMEW